jgi:heavy metal sensor kinase
MKLRKTTISRFTRFIKSIKFRFTLWLLMVLVVPMVLFGTAAYFLLSYNLYRNMDYSLLARSEELKRIVATSSGQVIQEVKAGEFILFFDSQGQLTQQLGSNEVNIKFASVGTMATQSFAGNGSYTTAVSTEGQKARLYATALTDSSGQHITILVGRWLTDIEGVLKTYRVIVIYITLLLIVLVGFGGIFMTIRTLKPVDWIMDMIREVDGSDLKRRIDVNREDELGQLAVTLNEMMGRLERAFNRQRQFAANASHELRTPLSIIQAESSLAIAKERKPEEYRKSLELISNEVEYMSSVISELLYLARTDAGKEATNFKKINVKLLVSELATDVEVLAREKGLTFILGPLEEAHVKGDKVQLRQLFMNVIQNAIWYTPAGGTVFSSVILRDSQVIIQVKDTGIGISSEHLPHIFERFYRIDEASSRGHGGSGLGLAIARVIAQLHGGTIEVESRVDEGSTFKMIFPITH